VLCPVCGKPVVNYYEHSLIHVRELVERGIVGEEVFDFGVERRPVYIYRGRRYLSPRQVLVDVVADRVAARRRARGEGGCTA
jgi:hypothetical protein